MAEREVNGALAREHGLTEAEYERILSILGRTPTLTELGIFSVMWSEHCSYKSSRALLGQLPTKGPRVLQGPGENAGVVDIGDGQAVVFKMESHNHPSFIEPFQGAATGVGGILRDVFTMGARPIANLNALRFGRPDQPRTRFLVEGVVAGIGSYGNCVGVPTVGGDVAFDECYDGNNLVNAMTIGILRADRIFLGRAEGTGNPVIYVGSKTGRDGIHGATMASAEFGEGSEEKRPTVQVGDPFTEKLLLEACLELMQTDCIVGIQDMGAAGLTSSSVEMAARGGSGLELDLDRVPRRETGMTAYELMLSESQERMLLVLRRGHEEQARKIFEKWDLDYAVVGHVTDGGRLRVQFEGHVVADLPTGPLAEGLRYDRPRAPPAREAEGAQVAPPADLAATALAILGSPTVASKEWVYRQYDTQVRNMTVVLPGAADAAVMRIEREGGAAKGLAATVDCNARFCFLDPYEGARLAVAEAARNLCCVGAEPLAVTDCLNFGNPERPEIMWQFAEAVRGLAEACSALGTPVVSGNVSFYNETDGRAIFPTPMVGMVGLLADVGKHVTQGFRGEGEIVALLGENTDETGGSEYRKVIQARLAGRPPRLDWERERAVQRACLALAAQGHLRSAHDCSEGGLFVAIAESCLTGPEPIGVELSLESTLRPDLLLFAEAPSRIVISFRPDAEPAVVDAAKEVGAPLTLLGKTGGRRLDFGKHLELRLEDALAAWQGGFRRVAE